MFHNGISGIFVFFEVAEFIKRIKLVYHCMGGVCRAWRERVFAREVREGLRAREAVEVGRGEKNDALTAEVS